MFYSKANLSFRFLTIVAILMTFSAPSAAQDGSVEVLFDEDFADPIDGNPSPVWSWNIQDGAREGMMLGVGDVYQRVQKRKSLYEQYSMSHKHALQLDFSGRNGFCNSCGGQYLEVTSVDQGVACVKADTTNSHENFVYNLSNHFSVWEISGKETTAGEVCFNVTTPTKEAINQQPSTVSVGNKIFLPNLCGVSGNVGRDISRKSDCNKAVNYLSGIGAADFQYGDTLARRFYFYLGEDAELPDVTFKLAYSYWQRPGEKVRGAELNLSVQRDLSFSLLTPKGERVTLSSPEHIHFEQGKWYYVEEVFERESAEGKKDGAYTLYAAPAGEEHDIKPTISINGFEIGELRRMSVGGNWQHYENVKGHVYFDNIKIVKGGRVGPVARIKIGK